MSILSRLNLIRPLRTYLSALNTAGELYRRSLACRSRGRMARYDDLIAGHYLRAADAHERSRLIRMLPVSGPETLRRLARLHQQNAEAIRATPAPPRRVTWTPPDIFAEHAAHLAADRRQREWDDAARWTPGPTREVASAAGWS